MTGTISVAMCTFNGESFLREQLESLAWQTRLPDELVVCDDASSDSTANILQEFARRAPFSLRIIRNLATLGSTRNFEKTIKLCEGDFIALCDQDDIWEPNKLNRLMEAFADPSVGGVFSDATVIDASAQPTGRQLWNHHRFQFGRRDDFCREAAIRLLLKHDVVTGATLMFRATLRNLLCPISDLWVHDGWIAWMLVLYSRLTFVAEPLVRYRVHLGQQLGIGQLGRRRPLFGDDRRKLAGMAAQFEALRERWISSPGEGFEECLALIENKITFLRRRSRLPGNALGRAYAVLSLTRSYRRFARGLSSMRSDLFLPSEVVPYCG